MWSWLRSHSSMQPFVQLAPEQYHNVHLDSIILLYGDSPVVHGTGGRRYTAGITQQIGGFAALVSNRSTVTVTALELMVRGTWDNHGSILSRWKRPAFTCKVLVQGEFPSGVDSVRSQNTWLVFELPVGTRVETVTVLRMYQKL